MTSKCAIRDDDLRDAALRVIEHASDENLYTLDKALCESYGEDEYISRHIWLVCESIYKTAKKHIHKRNRILAKYSSKLERAQNKFDEINTEQSLKLQQVNSKYNRKARNLLSNLNE